MSKSGKECIAQRDLDTAFARYENTNSRWKGYWYEICEQIYFTSKKWANKYVISPVTKTIERIKEKVANERIIYNVEKINFPKKTELAYLIRLLDRNKRLICSKIGTTNRSVQQRMKEHLRYYAKDEVEYIVVDKVWDCGETQAEGFESYFRAISMKNFPNTWKKNDRFFGVEFPQGYADKLFAEYQTV